MGRCVAARVVSILTRLDTFTEFHRRFMYLGSQLASVIVLETTFPMEANAFEYHFVAGRPRRMVNWDTDCISTIRTGYTYMAIPGDESHSIKAIGALPLEDYICR